jgi:glycosyltransferase involved in cell wall biosynthesis
MMRQPLVSITIPCYRQLEMARRCLDTIRAQSFLDFEVTLADDGESEEYRSYVASLGDVRVRYARNPVRLGAMKNMFQAIAAGRGKYSLAFHEDDLLGRDYLSAAVAILESHPSCGFVAAEIREFRDEPDGATLSRPCPSPSFEPAACGAEFLRAIFRGIEPMFGSIVYRRSAIEGLVPELDEFATLVDRPFLLTILKRWSAAIVREPLAWYRAHGEDEGRHRTMTAEHVLKLFRTYRSTLPKRLDAEDRSLFYAYSGYWLIALYHLVPAAGRPSLRSFLFQAWREGLYDPGHRGRASYRQALKAMLGVGARVSR